MYQKYISQKKYQLESIESNINTLNPLSILKRGYSVITNKHGKIIKSYKDVNDKEMVSARLGKGTIDLEVKK
jgi:exodeoxyribonuclease VII large subunit